MSTGIIASPEETPEEETVEPADDIEEPIIDPVESVQE
jgi:hypothetical protein